MAVETVTVCCKMPNGLMAEVADVTFEDIAGSKVATKQNIQKMHFRGVAEQRRLERDGTVIGETAHIIGGYGMTQVSAEFWERWWAENADPSRGGKATHCYAPIAAGLIWAKPKPSDAKAKAKEMAGVRSGLEPIKPTVVDTNGKITSGEVDARMGRSVATRRDDDQ